MRSLRDFIDEFSNFEIVSTLVLAGLIVVGAIYY